jgi:hypothetical protein
MHQTMVDVFYFEVSSLWVTWVLYNSHPGIQEPNKTMENHHVWRENAGKDLPGPSCKLVSNSIYPLDTMNPNPLSRVMPRPYSWAAQRGHFAKGLSPGRFSEVAVATQFWKGAFGLVGGGRCTWSFQEMKTGTCWNMLTWNIMKL